MMHPLLISITEDILDGHLALPGSKVDVHVVVSFSVSNHSCLLLLLPQVLGLLEVLVGAAVETPAGWGNQHRDGVGVAVRAENSHPHRAQTAGLTTVALTGEPALSCTGSDCPTLSLFLLFLSQ